MFKLMNLGFHILELLLGLKNSKTKRTVLLVKL